MAEHVVELVHVVVIAAWLVSLPLLFWHRWPRLSWWAAAYALVFVAINRLSTWFLGECILTRAARWCGGGWDNEWFSVKLARLAGVALAARDIVAIEHLLFLIVFVGAFWTLLWKKR